MDDKGVPRVNMQVRLPAELHEQIVALAQRQERSLNGQIVVLLRSALSGRRAPAAPPAPETDNAAGPVGSDIRVRVKRLGPTMRDVSRKDGPLLGSASGPDAEGFYLVRLDRPVLQHKGGEWVTEIRRRGDEIVDLS